MQRRWKPPPFPPRPRQTGGFRSVLEEGAIQGFISKEVSRILKKNIYISLDSINLPMDRVYDRSLFNYLQIHIGHFRQPKSVFLEINMNIVIKISVQP